MANGKYIVLEGPIGVGKTTQLLMLQQRLEAAGRLVVSYYGSTIPSLTSAAVKRLAHEPDRPLSQTSELLLDSAVLAQTIQNVKASVAGGAVCLVDGNYLTQLADGYYGASGYSDYETINQILSFAVSGTEPDLCIVLDAPVKTIASHLSKHQPNDLDPALLERIRAGYLWEAKQRAFPVVYVADDPHETADMIWKLVREAIAAVPATPNDPTPLKAILEAKHLPVPHEPPVELITAMPSPREAPVVAAIAAKIEPDTDEARNYNVSFLATDIVVQAPRAAGLKLQFQPLTGLAVNLPFYIPADLPEAVRGDYTATIIEILSLHTRLSQQLTNHLINRADQEAAQQLISETLRSVLPLAVRRTVTATGSGKQATTFTTQLGEHSFVEAQTLVGHSEASSPVDEGAFAQLAQDALSSSLAAEPEAVVLVDYWPRNQFDLLLAMVFDQTDKSSEQLARELSALAYADKSKLFEAYLRHSAGDYNSAYALQKARYNWELTTDYDTYLAFVEAGVGNIVRQMPTPRFGYETPELIDETSLNDEYEHCFDLSLQLYSRLQESGFATEAPYATLLGHRLRWSMTITAAQLVSLCQTTTPTTRSTLQLLIEQLQDIHPQLASCLDAALMAQEVSNQSHEADPIQVIAT